MSFSTYTNWDITFVKKLSVQTKKSSTLFVIDCHIRLMGVNFPAWSGNAALFNVVDYQNITFIEVKNIAKVRQMGEWKLKTKNELVHALVM